uniref:Putative g protein-coupled receptor n=1 Tax=Lutzomyia longipalpis TaxID=7200 RepID=A0A1B0CK17_LUTLO
MRIKFLCIGPVYEGMHIRFFHRTVLQLRHLYMTHYICVLNHLKALPTGLPNGYICLLVSEAKKWEKDCFQWGVRPVCEEMHILLYHPTALQLRHFYMTHYLCVLNHLKCYQQDYQMDTFAFSSRKQRNGKKIVSNGVYGRFDPFLWQLPGSDIFGNVFDEIEFSKWRVEGQRHPDGNCLALSREGNFRRIYIEDCSEEYPSVCIYNEKKHYLKLACPGESVTMRLHGEYDQCLEAFHDVFENSANIHYNFIHKTSLVKQKPDNYLCLSSIPGFDSNDYIWDYEKWLDVENGTQETFWNSYMHTYKRNELVYDNSYTVLDSRGQWVTFNNYNCKACITESSTDCECFFQVNTLNKNTFYRQAFHDIFESSAHIHYNFIHKTSLVKPKPDNYLCLSSIPGFDSNDYIWDYEKWLDVENETQETFWNFYMHTYERNEPDNENSYTSYTVLDSRGQWVTFNNYNCKACVSVVKIITPEIYVVFHQERQALELIVYSEEFLWRRDEDDSGVTCFTDAGGNTLLTNVRKDLIWKDKIKTTDIIGQSNNFIREYITKSIYQLEFEYSTPGHYWCEGLSLPDFKEVKSRQVVAYEEYDGTVYSFRATMNCNKCERGFTKKELKELSKNFKSFLKKFDSHEKLFGDAKVMQIKNIPQDSTKLEVIFHVVVEYNDFSFNCPQNITHHICTLYGIQRDLEIITRNASHSEKHDQFKNITVRHTAFCLPYRSSQTNEDYWMSAEIGERSVLQNLCLTTNLLPVYRICKGDFIIGAQWDEDHVPICHEMEIPNLTQKLFELDNSNKNSSTIIDEMQEIVEVDSREIIPADLERQALELIVYSEEYLWRRDDDDSGVTCFTDAGGNTLLTNVKKDLVWKDKIKTTDIIGQSNDFVREYITKSIYQLEFEYSTPGHYWCEGLSLPDFKEVKSPQVVAYKEYDGTVYSFKATVNCNKCERGFTKKELKELSEDFKNFLKKFDSREKLFGAVKVMRIQNIPQDSSRLEVIFHVVVEFDDFSFNCPPNITHHICTLYGIQRDLEIITRDASHSEKNDQFKNITVRHTAFCLPYRSSQTNQEYWMSAEIGERSVLQNLCLTTNLLPVYRICKGDFIIGAQWDEDHVPICHEMEIPKLTQKLFELDNSNKNSSTIIDEMQEIVEVDSREIIPADLYIVGTLLRKCAMEASNIIEFGLKEVGKILSILSHIMEVNETTARASQVLNSTNVLMDMNEKIITSVLLDASISNKTLPGNETNDLGVIEIKAKNIIVFTINPFVANVTGIALYRSSNQSNDIEDLIPRYLYANQDATELLMDNEELEVATFVPEDLLQRINEINQTASGNVTLAPKPPLRIVIMVKANDRLYQENRNVSYFRANGRVVSVTIPGYGPNLPSLLPLIFHTLYEITNETNACGFWDFTPTNKNGTSQWATRGCEFLLSSPNLDPPLVLCGCSHLTDFASLVMGAYKNDIPLNKLSIHKNHLIALDVITTVGCSLSIVGILGIWITAIFFKSWRQRTGSKVLLQLSAAIALQMFLFLFINAEYVLKDYLNVNQKIICITLGALLQYSVLVVFSWMLIIAYLQYLRYVVVFGNRKPAHFTIKSIIVGWIMPTVPVFLVIGLDMTSYLPPKKDFHGFCYPQGNSLYLGILLPIALILVANLGLYIAVIYSITRKMDGRKNSRKKKQRIQKAQLRLSVFLFFLLGMTWVFGFLIYTHRSPYIIFEYLFCLTATIQGFVVFVYFVILDPATRNLWENFFYMLCCRRSKNRNYYLQ